MSYLIALDGTDASGKATQTALLEKRLSDDGFSVRTVSFPDYDSPSSGPLKMYLEGKLGKDPNDTSAYAASVLFAVDRFASFRSQWRDFYEKPDGVILLNRYTTSNAVHQLSKIDDPAEKDAFLSWLFDFEYRLLGVPAPDAVIYLEMPTDISLLLLEKRCEETGAKKDIHEQDARHLYKSHAAALYACEKYGWDRIVCGENGKPYSVEKIHEKVYAAFLAHLPKDFPRP